MRSTTSEVGGSVEGNHEGMQGCYVDTDLRQVECSSDKVWVAQLVRDYLGKLQEGTLIEQGKRWMAREYG